MKKSDRAGLEDSGTSQPSRTDQQTAHDDLREDSRSVLQPAVDELVSSPVTTQSGTNALLNYQIKAAEFHELALDRIACADELDLPQIDLDLITHAREVFWYTAVLAQGDQQERARQALLKDIPRLVETFEEINGGIEAMRPNLDDLESDTHPEDTQWEKHTENALALFKYPMAHMELDALVEEPHAKVEIFSVGSGQVPLNVTFTGEEDGHEVKSGVTARLSPQQAESLAAGLIESAEAAREQGETDADA